MEILAQSDIGLVRSSNQDAYKFGRISEEICWVVVCDGMGGANGGNVASSVAADMVEKHIQKKYKETFTNKEIAVFLTSMVEKINDKLFSMQEKDASLRGMGTTLELVLTTPGTAYIVHVGDSRVYGIREQRIKQHTTDHSVVQEMVDSGKLTPEQARTHPNKNYITRALGVSKDIKLDYIEAEWKTGDVLLLCTDGLSNYIVMEEMLAFSKDYQGEDLINTLVNTAKERGGSDNITVAVLYA